MDKPKIRMFQLPTVEQALKGQEILATYVARMRQGALEAGDLTSFTYYSEFATLIDAYASFFGPIIFTHQDMMAIYEAELEKPQQQRTGYENPALMDTRKISSIKKGLN